MFNRRNSLWLVAGFVVGFAWVLAAGEARAECRVISVEGARLATVRLLDAHGRELETVGRDALANIREARECSEDTRYLVIQYNGRGVLVQRTAMAVASTFGELPLCPCPGAISSAGDRLAADPGAGDNICRPNNQCGGLRR